MMSLPESASELVPFQLEMQRESGLLCASLTKRDADESLLLHLPMELRLEIYETAIGTPTWEIGGRYGCGSRIDLVKKKKNTWNAFHLTAVCRQIHAETIGLVMKRSTFAVRGPLRRLNLWLENMPYIKREHITSLQFCGNLNFMCMACAALWAREPLLLDTLPGLKHVHAKIIYHKHSDDRVDRYRDDMSESVWKQVMEILKVQKADRPTVRFQISSVKTSKTPEHSIVTSKDI
ncbi:hypothetical protein P171DRAFT_474860 [Karstenula rhodostoma CBS 690.94]|uniref:Uncharacterized protein n=1 Tax=Karstenula rhodostoma CBS 690.94 TaxID=1392251 RepID=A0A9P4PEG0_9PLEO|nr:hypothetical protein P171DRAFT_474860 [Karstenula rhodostoma CBS 690.94]